MPHPQPLNMLTDTPPHTAKPGPCYCTILHLAPVNVDQRTAMRLLTTDLMHLPDRCQFETQFADAMQLGIVATSMTEGTMTERQLPAYKS
jgi:hypothetical protein